jgi:hypothetical protein
MEKTSWFSTSGAVSLGWRIIILDSVISLLLGLLAALAGGSFTALGNGFGGGNGIPDLVFLIPVLIGLFLIFRSVIKREDNKSFWLFAFIGPLIISIGYVQIAHTFDPCYNGLWDLSSRIDGRIALCERFGSEINIHTRFHYLWHIVPTLPLVWLYGVLLKKRLPEVLEKKQTKEDA